ncbi:hypothetical protein O6H91_04G107900 [Diphasiastrum complanatum]|uniref:Uncharacterized protein n=1 Tax=Diphasiastrum complanatum TaxID=34168 RepID=A0ACC2E0C0_DIPCM|nr:hypothetical protein O6H91_04G107900 [Diphasiastrum complanatum]
MGSLKATMNWIASARARGILDRGATRMGWLAWRHMQTMDHQVAVSDPLSSSKNPTGDHVHRDFTAYEVSANRDTPAVHVICKDIRTTVRQEGRLCSINENIDKLSNSKINSKAAVATPELEGSDYLKRQVSSATNKNIVAEALPTVILVGRPNVGKSALFNRLTRRREALVYNTPDGHMTRDIREGTAKLGDLRFRILDTAGLETTAEPNSILSRTAGLTAAVFQKCHTVLFLVDARAGMQPLDADVGKWLRRYAKSLHTVLVLNKAEGIHSDPSGKLLAVMGEAHSLGFGEPVAVSAETGEGMTDLFDCLQRLLGKAEIHVTDQEAELQFQDADSESSVMDSMTIPLQLAIAGRPNVGKSTLLNALLREERVLTGPEPGLTRDAVRVGFDYKGKQVYLVDTAGWMQRSKVEGLVALGAMHARRNLMRAHIVALVLDAEEISKAKSSMRHSEAALARWVTQEGRGLVVVVNKMDLLSGKDSAAVREQVIRAVSEEIQKILPQVDGVPLVFVSALKGRGRSAIMNRVFESYEKWCTRLPTAQLNRWLAKVMNRRPSGVERGHGARIRYITQVKARPPTFVVFVTGSGRIDESELRFIASSLKEDFNLSGIPLRVLQRSSEDVR